MNTIAQRIPNAYQRSSIAAILFGVGLWVFLLIDILLADQTYFGLNNPDLLKIVSLYLESNPFQYFGIVFRFVLLFAGIIFAIQFFHDNLKVKIQPLPIYLIVGIAVPIVLVLLFTKIGTERHSLILGVVLAVCFSKMNEWGAQRAKMIRLVVISSGISVAALVALNASDLEWPPYKSLYELRYGSLRYWASWTTGLMDSGVAAVLFKVNDLGNFLYNVAFTIEFLVLALGLASFYRLPLAGVNMPSADKQNTAATAIPEPQQPAPPESNKPWPCPNCGTMNSNQTFKCMSCGYSLT